MHADDALQWWPTQFLRVLTCQNHFCVPDPIDAPIQCHGDTTCRLEDLGSANVVTTLHDITHTMLIRKHGFGARQPGDYRDQTHLFDGSLRHLDEALGGHVGLRAMFHEARGIAVEWIAVVFR